MSTYLVVAHQTATSPELTNELRAIANDDREAEFVLLVPSTASSHLWTWVEGGEIENARYNAGEAAGAMRKEGLTVIDTIISNPDPLESVREELAQTDRTYEAVVVSTFPARISRWLRQDLPNQIRSKCHIKVISVISHPRTSGRLVSGDTPIATAGQKSWEQLDLRTLASLRRSDAYSLDGKLGSLADVLYDYVTLEPVWLGVSSRPIPFRTYLIPAQSARLDAGHLQVPFRRDKVLGQPHVDIGEGIPSLMDEEHLYGYFGIPQERIRELRVLHARDELPGLEVNWQPIFENEAMLGKTRNR